MSRRSDMCLRVAQSQLNNPDPLNLALFQMNLHLAAINRTMEEDVTTESMNTNTGIHLSRLRDSAIKVKGRPDNNG